MSHLARALVAAAGIALATPASAQTPVYNWSGFYAGANVGYGWGDADTALTAPPFTVFTPINDPIVSAASPSGPLQPNGVIGGGQLGWNAQSSDWLFGIETDFQASGQKESVSLVGDSFNIQTGGGTFAVGSIGGTLEEKLQWFGTLRGRVGKVWDGLVVFGTGGLAYGNVKISGTETVSGIWTSGGACAAGCPFAGSASFSDSQTRLGWTIGAGVEGAAWAQNWTWKIEYLYIDLGRGSGNVPYSGSYTYTDPASITTAIASSAIYNARFTDHILRFGINYRFGG